MTATTYLRLLRIALVGVALSTTRAYGQTQTLARFGLAAGVTTPVSSFASDKNVGYHIGMLVDVRLPPTPFGFRFDGSFHELKYSGNSTRDQILMATGDALLKVPTGSMIVPYLIGGAGVYNSRNNFILIKRSTTQLGVNAGGGLRFELVDVTTFVEARYHRTGGDTGIRMLPVSVGILF